jgi:hypothetical protein
MPYRQVLITGLTNNWNAPERQNSHSSAKQSAHKTTVSLKIDTHRRRLPLPKPPLKLHLIQSKKIENLFFPFKTSAAFSLPGCDHETN